MATDDTPPPKPTAPGGGISGVPAPRSSPTPPGVGEARPEADLENTGEMPVVRNDLRKSARRTRALTGAFALIAASGTVALNPQVTSLGVRLFGQKDRLDVVEKKVADVQGEVTDLRQDVHEARKDTRALYRAVLERRPQERLEQPPPPPQDGGR